MTTDVTGGAVTPTTEAAITEAPVTEALKPKVPDPNEKRWAHMAKREKQIQIREAKLKADLAAFEGSRTDAQRAIDWQTKLKQKNFDVLSEAGITHDDLTQFLVNQPNAQDRLIHELRAKIEQIEGGQTKIQKDMEERTTNEYKAALQAISQEATHAAKGDLEKYELVNSNLEDAVAAATQLIEETWKAEGRVISVEEALNDIEEYYLETIYNSFSNSKKLKSKLSPPTPEPTKLPPPSMGKTPFSTAVREQQAAPKPPTRTLTHQQIPSANPTRGMSSRERAIAAFQGKLNS